MGDNTPIISVIGLGYVGLPVAVHMANHFQTVGYDLDSSRIHELQAGKDRTGEIQESELKTPKVHFTTNVEDLRVCNFHIVAVPTPIDSANSPNLEALRRASRDVAGILKKGDIVVYESTVYPGVTEEECTPVLEKHSSLKAGVDFKVGYSPERINPGDKEHDFTKITKVVSGQDKESLERISHVYGTVVKAGIFKARSIKVAEAAKVIENTQRDVNIALMNELSMIFDRMGISSHSVLEAAATKWNFLKFVPGLVGGHCIGVDPYYLTYKAQTLGYHPEVILAGRRINDNMGSFISQRIIKTLINRGHSIKNQRANVYGLTFKENCPDLRNTKVIEVIRELEDYGMKVSVSDACACKEESLREFGIELIESEDMKPALVSVFTVAHKEYYKLNPQNIESDLIFDLKNIFSSYPDSSRILTL